MSDAGSPEPVTVSTDGVTVRKALEPDRFSTPAVAFRMQSERDEPVVLRLVDPLPADAELDEVGFHPEYGSQYWTAEADRLTFEYRLEAREEYETVYGLRAEDPTDFMAEFDLEATAEDGEGEIEDVSDVVSADDSQAVRDLIAGSEEPPTTDAEVTFEANAGSESVDEVPPDTTTADTGPDADESEPIGVESSIGDTEDSAPDPDDGKGMAAEDETTIGELDDEPQSAEPAEADPDASVDEAVDDLLGGAMTDTPESDDLDDAIEEATIGEDSAETDDLLADDSEAGEPREVESSVDQDVAISDAADEVLGPSTDSTASMDADPANAAAPTDTDEPPESSAQPSISDADEDGVVAALASEIRSGDVDDADLETLTKALNQSTPSLDSRVRYLQNEMTDLAAYTEALEDFIDEHGNATGLLSELRDGLGDLEERVSSLDRRLSEGLDSLSIVEDRVETLDQRLDDRAAETATLEEDLAELQSSLETVQDTLSDVDDLQDDLGSVEDEVSNLSTDVRDIEADIESVKAFRDRFHTVFASEDLED